MNKLEIFVKYLSGICNFSNVTKPIHGNSLALGYPRFISNKKQAFQSFVKKKLKRYSLHRKIIDLASTFRGDV